VCDSSKRNRFEWNSERESNGIVSWNRVEPKLTSNEI
jgi:hypothetical protein